MVLADIHPSTSWRGVLLFLKEAELRGYGWLYLFGRADQPRADRHSASYSLMLLDRAGMKSSVQGFNQDREYESDFGVGEVFSPLLAEVQALGIKGLSWSALLLIRTAARGESHCSTCMSLGLPRPNKLQQHRAPKSQGQAPSGMFGHTTLSPAKHPLFMRTLGVHCDWGRRGRPTRLLL